MMCITVNRFRTYLHITFYCGQLRKHVRSTGHRRLARRGCPPDREAQHTSEPLEGGRGFSQPFHVSTNTSLVTAWTIAYNLGIATPEWVRELKIGDSTCSQNEK